MEAQKLATLADLLECPEERVELINGEIVRWPMARAEHGLAQSATTIELGAFTCGHDPGVWWIADAHQCPSHDLAGWRKERLPQRPSGVMEVAPDWVCEIVSPGHERKDTLTLLLLLQRHRVPFYWLIWPEDRALLAYALDGASYRIVASLTLSGDTPERVAVPPFEAAPIDLGYILGG